MGKTKLKAKYLDEQRAMALYRKGHTDTGIADLLGVKEYQVTKFRQKNGLQVNGSCYLDKEYLRERLPKIGQEMDKGPSFLIVDNCLEKPAFPCRVTHVNREKLHYTVEFGSGMRETYHVY